jgi:L-ascorbate metabolism protein UlaG (beta-lactamase superfamily)
MKTKLFLTLIITAVIFTPANSQQRTVEVTYIANCGFMIRINDKKILIDALFKVGPENYLSPSDTIISKIQNGQEPFAHANLLLITHRHPDHFNAPQIARYLKNNPENILIAPSLGMDWIRHQADITIPDIQLIEIPKLNVQSIDTIIRGVKIQTFPLQHDDRPGVQNYGYLFEIDGIKIFHTGDNTGAVAAEYENAQLQSKNIDLALLNYYGFWDSRELRDFTKKYINPKNIVLMHVPPKEVEAVMDSSSRIKDFVEITVFKNSMDKKIFSFNR